MKRDRRLERERPYLAEHAASRSATFVPRGFDGLRRWFLRQWRDELPEEIHTVGVEFEKPGVITRENGTVVTDPGGGSRLGSPAFAPAFRVLLTGIERADGTIQPAEARTEHAVSDGRAEATRSYATPLRWTIAFLERRRPLIAAVLRRLGRTDGDWQGLAVTCGTCRSAVTLPDEYAEAIARVALAAAAEAYRTAPVARSTSWLEKSDSQRTAEEAVA